ncbi:hypothetical protein WHI96_21180 [Pseudonocardia tropica]|uniref:Uncharacterized protein n=1 Tax=Pseudonocardia tropica TaxID=681289 RepID=A0ABV1K0H5_9PSEU
MSEYTVLDHVKRPFATFGVSGRGEPTAALFFDHYADARSGRRPGGYGRVEDGAGTGRGGRRDLEHP